MASVESSSLQVLRACSAPRSRIPPTQHLSESHPSTPPYQDTPSTPRVREKYCNLKTRSLDIQEADCHCSTLRHLHSICQLSELYATCCKNRSGVNVVHLSYVFTSRWLSFDSSWFSWLLISHSSSFGYFCNATPLCSLKTYWFDLLGINNLFTQRARPGCKPRTTEWGAGTLCMMPKGNPRTKPWKRLSCLSWQYTSYLLHFYINYMYFKSAQDSFNFYTKNLENMRMSSTALRICHAQRPHAHTHHIHKFPV